VTSRIGVVMAEGLGAPAALPDAVSLIVPDAADWALIHMLADHGGVSRAVAHRDPAIQADIERIHARIAFNQDMPYGPAQVMRTGESSFHPRVRPEVVSTISRTYPEYAEILQRIGLGSQITVPLRARKTTVGALTLGRAARRPYTEAHLSWAEDLGHRIGLAVENARLYNEARQLFEQTLSANYVSTPGGQILACNQSFAELLGFDSAEHLVKHPAPAFYPNPDERERAVATLRTDRRLVGYESTVRRVDGTLLSISENAVGTFDDHGELVRITGFVLDRSNVKNLEEQLRQSQRLEAVGRLAGGIAHDFNNLLTVIIGCADLLRETRSPAVVEGHDALDELSKAAKRAAALTQQLLAFGRRQVLQPRVLDLNEALRNIHTMLRRLVRENIVIILNLDPGIDRVRVDPTARSGDHEPGDEQRRRDAEGRHDRGVDGEPGAHRRAHQSPSVCPPRTIRVARGRGYGHGNGRGDGGAGVRAVLHDEAAGQGHGTRPLDRLWDREAERRLRVGEQRTGSRHARQCLSADSSRESVVDSRRSTSSVPNSCVIDASAPANSVRSRAKQKRMYPSPAAPKSTPGTQPIRPCLIRCSTILQDSDSWPVREAGLIFRNA
jgi:PAS domain S-box-containing protein